MAFDVIVVGGGVMGCSIALCLAKRGVGTVVLERSVPGAEASTVAAGILAPLIEHGFAGPETRLGIASRERHAAWAASLHDALGIDVGFRRCGAMWAALDEAEAASLDARATRIAEAGGRVERLSPDDARRREPGLSPAVLGALDLPEEAQVEPTIFLRALALEAAREGVVFRTGEMVRRVLVEGGRARGVQLERGRLEAAHVVVAAGSWTSLVPGLPAPAAAVRPIRGQLVTCERRPLVARRVLFGAGGYIVPRPDGRVVCGATMEDKGFQKEVTLGGLAEVLSRALRLAPGLADAALLGHAVNFRPASPDTLPLVGPAGPEGLWLATGHHRNGILMAPLTAEIIADAITLTPSTLPDLPALDPRRFGASTTHPAEESP